MRSSGAACGFDLQLYVGFATWAELQCFAGALRNIDDNSSTWSDMIVHDHGDGLAVFEIGYSDVSA
jgi:hypothetical protein